MKSLLPLILLFLFLPFLAQATEIPEELKKLGFSDGDLIDYDKEGNIEYFIFANDIIKGFADIITFVIIDKDIVDYFEGCKK